MRKHGAVLHRRKACHINNHFVESLLQQIFINIGLAILGLIVTFMGVWAILLQMGRNARELAQEHREGIREIAQMTREVAFMIRRQYGDIDRDLQEMKELLGGSETGGAGRDIGSHQTRRMYGKQRPRIASSVRSRKALD